MIWLSISPVWCQLSPPSSLTENALSVPPVEAKTRRLAEESEATAKPVIDAPEGPLPERFHLLPPWLLRRTRGEAVAQVRSPRHQQLQEMAWVPRRQAVDRMWLLMAPDNYRRLGVGRGWSAPAYRTWLATEITALF